MAQYQKLARRTATAMLLDAIEQQRDFQPEKRLLWAMMKRWILDYTGVCTKLHQDEFPLDARFDAVEWCWSESIAPFSFLWVCDVLNLDAQWMRRSADKSAIRAQELGPLLGRIGSLEL
jgi:hypothetical protein